MKETESYNITNTEIYQERKKSIVEDTTTKCLICEETKPLCIIIPCEHRIICFECGQNMHLQNSPCPLCHTTLETVWQAS